MEVKWRKMACDCRANTKRPFHQPYLVQATVKRKIIWMGVRLRAGDMITGFGKTCIAKRNARKDCIRTSYTNLARTGKHERTRNSVCLIQKVGESFSPLLADVLSFIFVRRMCTHAQHPPYTLTLLICARFQHNFANVSLLSLCK